MRRHALFGAAIGLLLAFLGPWEAPSDPGLSHGSLAIAAAVLLVPLGALSGVAAPLAFRNAKELPFLRTAWLAGSAFFALAGIATTWSARERADTFASGGDSTIGRVVSIHPEDHNTVAVEYVAAGKPYHRRLIAGIAPDRAIGSTVTVYYLRRSPSQADLEWPQWHPLEDLLSFGIGAILLPTIVIGFAGSWLRHRAALAPNGAI